MPDSNPSRPKLLVMNVGVGPANAQAAPIDGLLQQFVDGGFEIELANVDANPELNPEIIWDITQPPAAELEHKFDVIYCSHTLEHIPYPQVITVLKHFKSCLKVGGELYVIVPALEWAAKEIVMGREDGWLMGFLYGNQQNEWEVHRSGFTLAALRGIISIVGFTVREAYQSWFGISLSQEGEEPVNFSCRQNVVLAANFGQE